MASSSSSHQQKEENQAFSGIEPPGKRRKVDESSRLFDVFINHRGPDVKQTLATQLYNSLEELEIKAFLDCKEMELGDAVPSTIETAISSAAVHIAIFSKGYAESPWCLVELVLMLQSQAKIIPVFYDVQPWELRHIEKGVYVKEFIDYEKKGRYVEKLKEWKEALQTVSFITGEVFNGDCKSIVSTVQKEVQRSRSKLYVAKYPVGLHNLVQDFQKKCLDDLVDDFESQFGKNDKGKVNAQITGIFGMGGVGKTTLSKELFNRKRSQYHRACFLFDVREASAKGVFPSLQIKLLKDIFNQNPPNFQSIDEGTSYIGDCIERSHNLSFLVVLDDIDHVEQLNALLSIDMLKKSSNCLVIVTTRDIGVLISTGITKVYNLKGMNRNTARELFCWHAFQQAHPTSGYEDLVDAFLDGCGGLPLSLQVLGTHVHGRDPNYWKLELNKIKKTLPRDIQQRLKISFDALDTEEKEVFMDIACFFIHKEKNIALRVWDGLGWNAHHALQKLQDRCLVEHDGSEWHGNLLNMHDHLRDLGREMASKVSCPYRVWHPQHIKCLELEGFRAIISKSDLRCFTAIKDRFMDATITFFIGNLDDWGPPSISVLWLKINFNGCTHTNISSWIPLQNLQCLIIGNGHVERLWHSDVQEPSSLKELAIYDTHLDEFPYLCGMSSHLEKVTLNEEELPIEWWSFLESLRSSPKSMGLRRFEFLSTDPKILVIFRSLSSRAYLSGFVFVGIVALNVKSPLSSLQSVKFVNQEFVTKVLISGYHHPSLESVDLGKMKNLTEVGLNMVTTLTSLKLRSCENLKCVAGVGDLTNLVVLIIDMCSELELPCLSHLSCLQEVEIYKCQKLKCLQLDDCANLKTVKVSDLPELVIFSISHCPELQQLSHLEGLNSLKRIIIDGCWKLVYLIIAECEELEELCVAGLSFLESLKIERCEKLQNIAGIEELPGLESMQLKLCGNAAMRNSIHRLQKVPSERLIAIGSGVEGAETMLNPDLFSEWITAEAVIKFDVQENIAPLDIMKIIPSCLSAIIICAVVPLHFFSECAEISDLRVWGGALKLMSLSAVNIDKGNWICATLLTDRELYDAIPDIKKLFELSWLHRQHGTPVWSAGEGTINKFYMVMVKKGEEWKTLNVMKIIFDRLLK